MFPIFSVESEGTEVPQMSKLSTGHLSGDSESIRSVNNGLGITIKLEDGLCSSSVVVHVFRYVIAQSSNTLLAVSER